MKENKPMGDLIFQLPTDEIVVSKEDRDNAVLLFGSKKQERIQSAPIQESVPPATTIDVPLPATVAPHAYLRLRRELTGFVVYMCLFFIAGIPVIDAVLIKFVPLCGKSWIVRAVLKAFLLSLIVWIMNNSRFLKVN